MPLTTQGIGKNDHATMLSATADLLWQLTMSLDAWPWMEIHHRFYRLPRVAHAVWICLVAASAAFMRLAAQSSIQMSTLIGNPKQQFSQGCQSLNRVWVSGRIKLDSASIGHHEGRFDSQGAVHRDVSSDHLKSCEEVLSGLIV